MSQSLAVINNDEPRGLSIREMSEISEVFVKSGFFADLKSQAQAVVKMMAGAELGLEPFAAMSELHVIQGKITMSAGLLAKKVKQSGRYNYLVVEHSDKICSIDFYEAGQKVGNSTFTLEDAKKAQVKNLDKYPKNMLFARAISNGVRFYCPDVTGSVAAYVDGEIDTEPAMKIVKSEPQTQVIDAEPVQEIDDSYIKAINALIETTGVDIAPHLKRAGVNRVAELSQLQADKLIGWLEKKEAAMEASN